MLTIKTFARPLGSVRDGAPLSVVDPTYLHEFGSQAPLDFAAVTRISNLPLAGGQWEAFAGVADVLDDGEHVVRAGIQLIDAPAEFRVEEECIISDSGVLGYYINTPIVFWDDVHILHLLVGPTPRVRVIDRDDALAFFTESGLGDGGYTLNIRYAGDRVIGVEAIFVHDEQDAATWIKFHLTDDDE